jgi:hypothetical protein
MAVNSIVELPKSKGFDSNFTVVDTATSSSAADQSKGAAIDDVARAGLFTRSTGPLGSLLIITYLPLGNVPEEHTHSGATHGLENLAAKAKACGCPKLVHSFVAFCRMPC